MSPRKTTTAAVLENEDTLKVITAKPEQRISDPIKALKIIREDLGDCTRCPFHKQGRKQIVFGVGNPKQSCYSSARARARTKTKKVSRSLAVPDNSSPT